MNKKTVVITGGSGLAIVERLLAASYRVVHLARRRVPLSYDGVDDCEIDLLDRALVKEVAAEIAARNVYGFVHNAGVIHANLIENVALSELHELNQLHLGAAIQLVQALLPGIKKQRAGRIVSTSSRAAVGVKNSRQLFGNKSCPDCVGADLDVRIG